MSTALDAQAKIFHEEQIARRQSQADQELQALISLLSEVADSAEQWRWARDADGHILELGVIGPFLPNELGIRERFFRVIHTISHFRKAWRENIKEAGFPEFVPSKGASQKALQILRQMTEIRSEISPPAKIFQPHEQILDSICELEKILADEQYWA